MCVFIVETDSVAKNLVAPAAQVSKSELLPSGIMFIEGGGVVET